MDVGKHLFINLRSYLGLLTLTRMQEEVLSNRTLIFVNNQVYFRCRRTEYSEELNWSGKMDRGPQGSLQTILSDNTADFTRWTTLIYYYSRRKPSFVDDTLRAAQGMLRKYSIVSEVHCFEGMSPPFEQSFLFKPLWEGPMERREGFPSYSWAGWTRQIYWGDMNLAKLVTDHASLKAHKEAPNVRFRTWISWFCKLKDGNIYRINRTGRLRRISTPNPPVLDLSSLSPDSSFQQVPVSVSDATFDAVRISKYPLLYFWTVCINVRYLKEENRYYNWTARDRNDEPCGQVFLDLASPTTSTGEGQLAILAETAHEFWALLLQWEDGIAERRGTALLSLDVLERCLPPGPHWTAVVLG